VRARGLCLLVVALGASALAGAASAFAVPVRDAPVRAVAAATTPLLTTTADVRRRGKPVERSFLGFSEEYEGASVVLGRKESPNLLARTLFHNLAAPGGGVPVLRIGGNSQDQAWWAQVGVARPRSVQIDLGPGFFERLQGFLASTGARAVVGLNLAINDPAYPVAVARGALASVDPKRILAFEVGNEPHVFPFRILALDEQGRTVFTRPPDYDHAQYMPELQRHVDALRAAVPRAALAAPGYCCNPWLRGLPTLLKKVGRKLDLIALHRYPLESCNLVPGDPGYPTLGELLSDRVINGPTLDLMTAARRAAGYGLKVRITETNSATCGGARKVSNAFGSALWLADWYFSLAAVGVAGADLHMSSPTYSAFDLYRGQKGPFAVIKPTYYGMLLFAEATPHRSRVLPSVLFRAKKRAGSNVKAWGFVDAHDKVVRVVILNKSPYQGGSVRLTIPFGSRRAKVRRLEAPALTSPGNVSWAGRSFELPTADGLIKGTERTEIVRRGRKHLYRLKVPAHSAALLTVPVSRTR